MDSKTARQPQSTTVRVDENGGLSLDIGPGSFGAGFSQLMDFSAPVFMPKPLPAEETTRIGLARTARALAKARDQFRG